MSSNRCFLLRAVLTSSRAEQILAGHLSNQMSCWRQQPWRARRPQTERGDEQFPACDLRPLVAPKLQLSERADWNFIILAGICSLNAFFLRKVIYSANTE
jgi:hypothetical protein